MASRFLQNIFVTTKNDIDGIQHHFALRTDEIEQLLEEGESDVVRKPLGTRI